MMNTRPSVILLGCCAALMTIAYMSLLRPKLAQLRSLRRDVAHLRSSVVAGQQVARQLRSARSRLQGARHAAVAVRQRFLRHASAQEFISELMRAATQSGVTAQQVRPGEVTSGLVCETMPIELELDVSFPDLFSMLQTLSDLNRPYGIDRISLQSTQASGKCRALIRLSVYLLEAKSSA